MGFLIYGSELGTPMVCCRMHGQPHVHLQLPTHDFGVTRLIGGEVPEDVCKVQHQAGSNGAGEFHNGKPVNEDGR